MELRERAYHPTHDMVVDEDGFVDEYRLNTGHCTGPECRRCGTWCHNCWPARAAEPCRPPDLA